MTINVLFKDGAYVIYTDIVSCVESSLFSGYICLLDKTQGIYLNKNEIISFRISKEETNEDN